MNTTDTQLDKPLEGKKLTVQLSNKALQDMIRPHAKKAIERLVELLSSKQETVSLGAAKVLLAKVLPDLKSVDLGSEDGIRFLIEIIQDNKLKDANAKDTTTNQALPSPREDILIAHEIQDSK